MKKKIKGTMRGNEKDCICAKENGAHRKYCDSYRTAQFLIYASAFMYPPQEEEMI